MSTTSVIAQGIVQIVAEGIDAVFDSVNRLAEAAQATTNALGRMSGAITRNIGRGLAAGFDAVGKSMHGIYFLIEKIRQGFSSIRFAVRGINHLFSLFAAVATGALGSLFYMAAKNSQEFGDFKDALKDLADAVGATLAPYLRAITAILRGVTQAYESLNPALRQTITNTIVLTVIVSQLATALITRLTSALTGITKLIAITFHILSAPFRVIGSMLAFLTETLFNVAGAIIQTVVPVFGTFVVVLVEIARRIILLGFFFFTAMIEPMVKLASVVTSLVLTALDSLVGVLITLAAKIIILALNALVPLVSAISTAAGLMMSLFLASTVAVQVISALIAGVIALVAAFVAFILIAKVVGAVIAGVFAGLVGILGLMKDAVEGVEQGIVNAKDGMVGFVQAGIRGIPALKDQLFGFVRLLRDDWPAAIKQVLVGMGELWNTILSGAQTAINGLSVAFIELGWTIKRAIGDAMGAIAKFYNNIARNNPRLAQLLGINNLMDENVGFQVGIDRLKAIGGIDGKWPDAVDFSKLKINMDEWERGVDKIIAKMRAFAPQLADWFKRGKGFAMDMLGVFMNLMEPGGFNEKSKSKFESLDQTWQRMVTADQSKEKEGLDLVKAIRAGLEKWFPDLLGKIDKALPAIRK